MKNQFSKVGILQPGRSMFDLSYDKKFTCDMGQLIPIMCDECVPGDLFKIANQAVIRTQPLVAPLMHEVNMTVHYFYVPYRILDETFEEFITGGEDGESTVEPPRWEVINNAIGSLWDYLGFPTGVDPDGAYPLDYPRLAYNYIFNEYYRDESLQNEVALNNEAILIRNWPKDYYTSAQLSQQRGVAPALPISGTTQAIWSPNNVNQGVAGEPVYVKNTVGTDGRFWLYNPRKDNLIAALNNNTVDLSTASTFDIADLRLAIQIQKWMERNQRAGVRYTEFLHSHFGVSPRDSRLQRPEYIGGSKTPLIVSEVLQTSSTDTESPQGNLAGHGIAVADSYCGSYHVQEYGLIMGILSIMPKAAYQQGIDRQWLRRTRYDFYFPEFAHLSEQAIEQAEIYATGVPAENRTIFGYQGRYDEMRVKHNQVCSEMRSTFDYWHLGRQFSSAPILNETFIKCVPRKDIFAVQNVPGLIVWFGNIIKAFRPLPVISNPGLMDHF
nr:MAG: major capsid protein [Microvirus sp.]